MNAELRAVLDKAVRDGKVRHLGNSVSSNSTATGGPTPGRRLRPTPTSRRSRSSTTASTASPKSRAAQLPKQNLGVLARVPLASGLLSGKYKPGAAFHRAMCGTITTPPK